MSKDFDIVVVGELNPDLVLRGDVSPAFGQVEQLVDEATLTIGSSSAIFACGAARLGLRVAFIGVMGDDEFGRFMHGELVKRRVDTSGIIVTPSLKTGLTVILSRPSGDRAVLTFAGSIGALRYDEIDFALVSRARHLHLGSFFMLDNLRPDIPRLFAQAKSLGLTVSLDTNYDPTEQWDGGLAKTLPSVDIFLPNQTELLAITRTGSVADGLAALSRQVPTVAIKLGAAGAVAQQGEITAQADILPVALVDTTGAGDSFDAGFIYGYLSGWDLRRTLRLATVCGSLSTRAAGGTGAQAMLEEALGYMK
ncbi:MAG: sugar kinase [Anaerolineae bacterium]